MEGAHEIRTGYLYVKTTGTFRLTKARELLLKWLEIARAARLNRILCDMTPLAGFDDELALTMIQYESAAFVAETLPRDFRIAFLQTPRQFQKDHFGENVMRGKGAAVRVTSNPKEALDWLIPGEDGALLEASACAVHSREEAPSLRAVKLHLDATQ